MRQSRTCNNLPFLTEIYWLSALNPAHPEPCSMQNWTAAHTASFDALRWHFIQHLLVASLTQWNKPNGTQQSAQSSTAIPSQTGKGRCFRLCVGLNKLRSLDRGGAFFYILGSKDQSFHTQWTTKHCIHVGRIMFLVQLQYWSYSVKGGYTSQQDQQQLSFHTASLDLFEISVSTPPGSQTSRFYLNPVAIFSCVFLFTVPLATGLNQ